MVKAIRIQFQEKTISIADAVDRYYKQPECLLSKEKSVALVKRIEEFEKNYGSFLDALVVWNNYKRISWWGNRSFFVKANNILKNSTTGSFPLNTIFKKRQLTHLDLEKPACFATNLFDFLTFIPRFVVSCFLEWIIASFLLVVGFLFSTSSGNPEVIDPKKPTWLMIHGKGSNWTTWLPVYFYCKGLGNLFSFNMEKQLLMSNGHDVSLQDYAKALEKKVRTLFQEKGVKELRILAHSAGGIVAIALLNLLKNNPENRVSIPHIVTLNSPFQGCPLAVFQPWIRVSQELQPTSVYLQNIREKAEKFVLSGETHVTTMHSGPDYLVPPSYSKILGGKSDKHKLSAHISLLFLGLPAIRKIFLREQECFAKSSFVSR